MKAPIETSRKVCIYFALTGIICKGKKLQKPEAQGGFKNPFVAADVSRRIIQANTGTFAPTDVGGYERVLESALQRNSAKYPCRTHCPRRRRQTGIFFPAA
jgi:hypothetical protein